MDDDSARRKQPTSQKFVDHSRAGDPTSKQAHASHRTRLVKIRGLLMDLPGTDGPVEVCVNHQPDWELIYKNPAVHVKCLVPSCDTLLTAKRMSRSGLRFFSTRSGGCSHNTVEMRVERDEIAQDPATLDGGGGPEGVEHLWIKGRLYSIAKTLGTEAVVEHSPTHGDVFLPEHDLVLEYQRWDTDFESRTQQRTSAGAARTIWLFPSQLPDGAPTSLRKKFDKEVFQNGGIYVSVLNPSRNYEPQSPWDNPAQERTALLFASGSVAAFDSKRQALVYKSRSLARTLDEILSGKRVLERAPVWKKGLQRLESARVWALRDDLELAEAAQSRRRLASPPVSSARPATEYSAESQSEQRAIPGHGPGAELHDPRLRSEISPPAASDGHISGLPEPANTEADSMAVPDFAPAVDVATSAPQQTENQKTSTEQPAPHRTWWKKIVHWLRLR